MEFVISNALNILMIIIITTNVILVMSLAKVVMEINSIIVFPVISLTIIYQSFVKSVKLTVKSV